MSSLSFIQPKQDRFPGVATRETFLLRSLSKDQRKKEMLAEKRFRSIGISNSLDIRETLAVASMDRIVNYFKVAEEIEREVPGAIAFLHKNFGIVTLDRFGAARLLRQFKYVQSVLSGGSNRRVSLVSIAMADKNEAFIDRGLKDQSYDRFDEFQHDEGLGGVLYSEFNSPRRFLRTALFISSVFGPAKSLWLGSHSTGENILVNTVPKVSESERSDNTVALDEVPANSLYKINAKMIDMVLAKDGYVIVDACMVGFNANSFAVKLSKVVRDRFIIAPNGNSEIMWIRENTNPDLPPIVDFGDKSDTRVFINGLPWSGLSIYNRAVNVFKGERRRGGFHE